MGCQDGELPVIRWVAPVPSGATPVQMPAGGPFEKKAIFVPSGENAGARPS